MGQLTALQVKKAKPGRHADGKGLYLLVKPKAEGDSVVGGARSWVLRVVVNGRRRDFGLGAADLVTLGEARDKAIEGRRFARAGLDPSIEWRRATATIPTFEQAARECHTNSKAGWRNGKHRDQWLKTLETYAFPSLGALRVDLIDAPLMWAALGPIWQEKQETARRVKQRMGTVLDYSKAKGWRATEAPMRALSRLASRQRAARGHFAALPYKQLPAVVATLRGGGATAGRLAVLLTLLTAARPGNVRGSRWREVNWGAAEWTISGEGMKGGLAHVVPLVPAAIDVLQAALGVAKALGRAEPNDFIFPGLKKDRSLSDATLGKAFKAAGGQGYTLHGTARSSFRDWAAECTSFPGEWAEAALAHKVKNQTEAAYRRTTFLELRRDKLMPAWAAFLDGKSNVVALAERRG